MSSVQVAAAPSASTRVFPFIRWAFYVFLFLIPFEMVYIPGLATEMFTMAKWAGILFALVACLQPNVCYARPPWAFWCFLTYVVVFLLVGLLGNTLYTEYTLWNSLTVLQCLILFWVGHNLMKDKQGMTGALMAIVAATLLLSALMALGIAQTVDEYDVEERVSALGEDPNYIGYVYSVAMLIVLNLAFGRKATSRWGLLMWGGCGVLALQVVRTGSRVPSLPFSAGPR